MPHLRHLLPCLLASTLALGLAGCSDALCDPGAVGEPWKAYEKLLPDNAVVCGPNRKSARKPSDVVDDYPPTHVFVFYKEGGAAENFGRTMERFEAAGWAVTGMDIHGEGDSALFDGKVSKDGVDIDIGVNRNDWGIQGSFDLKLPAAARP